MRVRLLQGRHILAASRRSFPLSASGWSVSPVWYGASRNSVRIPSASPAAPARTFSD